MKFDIKDKDKLVELLREHQAQDAKGYFSERKVRLMIDREVDNPKSLILVNKQITSVLVLMVVPSHFSTQSNIQEVCFYSKTAGSGFRLLKEAKEWIDKWGDGILYSAFISTGTEETNKMLERFGMKQIGVMFDMRGEY